MNSIKGGAYYHDQYQEYSEDDPILSGEEAKTIFTEYYDELDSKKISQIIHEFENLDTAYYPLNYLDDVDELYHWSCYYNTKSIAGDHYYNLDDYSPGLLYVNKMNEGQGISNVNNHAESVFEEALEYSDFDDSICPNNKTKDHIEEIAVYWYVNKNLATYFSPKKMNFKSMVEENCDGTFESQYVALWKFSDNYNNFLFLNDPESSNNSVMVIPKRNNGEIIVRLDKNDNYSSDEKKSAKSELEDIYESDGDYEDYDDY